MLFKKRITLLIPAIALTIAGCQQPTKSNTTSSTPAKQPAAGVDTVPAKMVLIKGGQFMMGTTDPLFKDATPVHKVTVSSFLMDEHEVTNAEF